MSDEEQVAAVARDYIESWFAADGPRMESALHPELAKRSVREDATLWTLTAPEMVGATAAGGGSEHADGPAPRVRVLHLGRTIATVLVESSLYLDHVQLVNEAGRWRIANAVWEPAA